MNEAERAALLHQSQKGGARQRKRALEILVRENQGSSDSRSGKSSQQKHDSELGKALVKDWAWGYKSAAEVQRLAAKAREDELALLRRCGLTDSLGSSMIAALAGLGANGKWVGNISKELKTYLGEPDIPAAPTFDVPVRILKPRRPNRLGGRMAIAIAPYSVSLQKLPF